MAETVKMFGDVFEIRRIGTFPTAHLQWKLLSIGINETLIVIPDSMSLQAQNIKDIFDTGFSRLAATNEFCIAVGHRNDEEIQEILDRY